MLEYMVGIWNGWLNKYPKSDHLPAVIPVVVHSGPNAGRWNKPLEIMDLIDVDPAAREALQPHLPRLRILLDDLGVVDAEALRARKELTAAARMVLILHKIAAGHRRLGTALLDFLADLREVRDGPHGRADLRVFTRYIMSVGETSEGNLEPVYERLGPDAEEIKMTTAEQLRSEGRSEGLSQGLSEGEGRVLLKLLRQKFGELPAGVVEMVRAADVSAVEVWVERVLTAHSLDEVFTP